MSKQLTLKNAFSLEGKGLHTGLLITVSFNPACENHGYKIQRMDLENQPIIDAVAENVVDTQRGTVIGNKEFTISTIEHAMAALYAYGIDNCLIQVDAPEFPILDGSAITYCEAIEQVGSSEQTAEKNYFTIRERMEIKDPTTGSIMTIFPDEEFSINCLVSYPSSVLSNQYAVLDSLNQFKTEIASSRTFVFVKEIEALAKHGLIKGGDLDNAIVVYDEKKTQQEIDNLAQLMNSETRDASKLGYINNRPLTFDNEPARHKLLDILGDIALVGMPIKGHLIATKPGHTINNKFARLIRKEVKRMNSLAPLYDPNIPPAMDTNRIKEILPHRWPFLMVDKILSISDKKIIGLKNVTANETFFCGHFPEEPVMPGVLQVEAMAQVGGLLVLSSVDEPERYSTYFMKIDNVKFRQKVSPGDTLIFKLELISEIRRGCANMKGTAFVGNKIVSEAEFMAQIIKNK